MPFKDAKIYSDGSHYIAIPKASNPYRRKKDTPQEDCAGQKNQTTDKTENKKSATAAEKKTEFERLYKEYADSPKTERNRNIAEAMAEYFEDDRAAQDFVRDNTERKKRNEIVRRTWLARKIHLQEWNWFCTFTFDDGKHTEQSFRTKLSTCLRHFSSRREWRYVGAWERSPEKQRLHFHGIFFIPETAMPGRLEERNDYSFNSHKRRIIMQNTYFNERFGRNDFSSIDTERDIGSAVAYLMKYIGKSGERLVYSRGLPTYFVSDIMEKDVICTIGKEDRKLLLSDDFECWDEGCFVGKVSPETIRLLRKSN